ncbi:phosphomevalonate kinase [Streptomyces fructofermentans]|uniref:phosphomevalonate kinase n=1 Tax=Streptomyces fructofermentans TaxID=152141 RepID=A0A918NSZ0_9ACTN|nr:phosphomevalonate kinase [Streptomyces fructofermentans]GGX93515.1 hypothetical protein GCM10010515_70520 [Streptomyces fructofermentans]
MAAGRTVVRRAPGKLFVAGEYAVVEAGNPAVLVAVDRQVTVTVSDPHPHPGPDPDLDTDSRAGPDTDTGTGTGTGIRPRPDFGDGPGSGGRSGSGGGSGAGARPLGRPEAVSGAASLPGAVSGAGVPGPGPVPRPRPEAEPEPGPRAGAEAGAGAWGPGVVISSDLGPQRVRWHWRDGRLVEYGPGGAEGARGRLAHVVSAVEVVGALLAERGRPVPAMDVRVGSRLHEDGRKYGLGSSGAVTVAAVAAVAARCALDLAPEDHYRLAMLATARIDARASGGDLAASTWGGWILYRAPDREHVLDLARRRGVGAMLAAPWPGFAVRRLRPPAGVALEVGWTGEPASTASLVSSLDRGTWQGSAAHRGFVRRTGALVAAVAEALDAGDGPGLLEQIRRARQELARLDEEAGLGIFTPGLTALCDAAEAFGGAAKPSGAGGGDCGIALLDARASREISHIRQRWATAGVLPLPIRPALEGIEE